MADRVSLETPTAIGVASETIGKAGAVAWPLESGEQSTIRMQLIDRAADAAARYPTFADISDRPGWNCDPFMVGAATGWAVAWLESGSAGEPAQVRLRFIGASDHSHWPSLPVHDEDGMGGREVHQHDVGLGAGVGASMLDSVHVVWVSTDLTGIDAAQADALPGRIMLKRYDLAAVGADAASEAPVQIGFGRSPAVTMLKNGDTAVTWIDRNGELQGVLIAADGPGATSLAGRMRPLSGSGAEQSKAESYFVRAIAAGSSGLFAMHAADPVNLTMQLSSLLLLDMLDQIIGRSSDRGDASQPPTTDRGEADGDGVQVEANAAIDGDAHESSYYAASAAPTTSAQVLAPPIEAVSVAPVGPPAAGSDGELAADSAPQGASSAALASAPGEAPSMSADAASVAAASATQAPCERGLSSLALELSSNPNQLGDGQGLVANAVLSAAECGIMAVWEETAGDGGTDLKGTYWSYDQSVASGESVLAGREFAIHAPTPDVVEHDAAVSSYAVATEGSGSVAQGFHVVYVASDAAATNSEYGAIRAARFEIPVDPQTGEQLFPVTVDQAGERQDAQEETHEETQDTAQAASDVPADGEATGSSHDDGYSHDDGVVTLADSGRDPSIATSASGTSLVAWIDEAGQPAAAVLVPEITNVADGPSSIAFEPAPVALGDQPAVAQDQHLETAALGDGSFAMVWVVDDGEGHYHFNGTHVSGSDSGAWSGNGTLLPIDNVNTSKSGGLIEFTLSPADGDGHSVVIRYRLHEGDDDDPAGAVWTQTVYTFGGDGDDDDDHDHGSASPAYGGASGGDAGSEGSAESLAALIDSDSLLIAPEFTTADAALASSDDQAPGASAGAGVDGAALPDIGVEVSVTTLLTMVIDDKNALDGHYLWLA
ncbi:MAG: hypothetical protein IT536_19285 [Hyphomicrobiales bacterium]|nr:hypothetical protein [Hyphomicrobiales bacterium]